MRARRASRARKAAARFFAEPKAKRAQRAHSFDSGVWKAVLHELVEVFSSKCAYCESVLVAAGVPELDHFRPKHNAIGVDGKVDEDHYWWLAYEWSNLYPTCSVCNRAKATRFPVDGRRAKPGATAKEVWKERRLLLDPCVDDPELHLVFSEDGHVASATQQGRTTIEVMALDRPGLVLARERAARVLRLEFDAIVAVDPPRRGAVAEAMLGPHAEYAAMRRQLVAKWLEAASAAPAELHEQLPDTAKVSELERELTREVFDASQQEQSDYSVAVPGADEYYRTTRFIERIEIENFRPIQELSLELGADLDDGRTPWLMLLGENGSGKSSVLQAVVLALAGESYRRRLKLDPARFLRHGTQSGSVTVHLTGVPDPIELSFSKGDRRFRGQPKEPKVLLLGYGATRLLPRPGSAPAVSEPFANVLNLFNPFFPLKNPTPWLLGLNKPTFDNVALALKRMLPLDEDDRFERRDGRVEVRRGPRDRATLDELSDGYQSAVALATDVMQVLLLRWPTIEAAEGIVALDELDAHLHPRWRMRMVDALRAVFPRVQFIVTTHDPLCLRGMVDGEVAVLKRAPTGRIYHEIPEGPLRGLRVDQLLMSEAFGLDSTTDPEIEELLAEHRALRRKQKPSKADLARREEVERRLDELQVLGRDRRERLMLEAADDFFEREVPPGPEAKVELKARTKRRIAEIFAEVDP